MLKIEARLNCLYNFIQSPEFLQKQGLANEVPYSIFDYAPEDECIVREFIQQTLVRMPVKITEVNLYHFLLSLFEEDGIESLLDYEVEEGTDSLFQDVIEPTIEEGEWVYQLEQQIQDAQVLFLTGVGSVYPMMRAHDVLNKLFSCQMDIPLILFYPGTYSGQDLRLFNRFSSNNYYRAFHIT
ncbi:uncharacterized protein DUF1788 [Aneurinibacillus soli]|uniref:Uncharacterized protein n=1 Tax=Aneurinibacillus soli TaxID=1500254 RepID=A0A0U5B166_9BACL|nr:DUF1788 domain-containing protein [Aneurinibacillus soli]PYE61921.1 uncharacterized protein DUF1788 [Aneurinibacillus soli]BAU29738.1 hypothetical protein CB4_03975 [Aneurinibacillus soli]